ncbi:HAAS signaling domain-containing protein [Pengzhenrongella phosphoraccumulans]|uniref:HAAS signaling domain-containing protein n=1 Tax=Pengzhenrongella phosphoraccumulans TaxID=3114394 RepID=UPI00388F81C6
MLDDLERALIGVVQAERADVLASIREHLEASLDGLSNFGTAEVECVLTRLGPVEGIAAETGHRQSPATAPKSGWPTWIGTLTTSHADAARDQGRTTLAMSSQR